MANYDNLISSIKAAIKPNGTQAITGQVLQDAMLEMVSQLGKNYAFGGVATTSTNPGTPSTNTLYIANEAGAYSNMGGVVLKTSELAVIIWDGKTWSKQTVLEDYVNKTQLDDAVGELSDVVNQNLARIGLCEQQIAEVNNALNGHSGSIEYLTSEITRLSKTYAFGGLVKPSTNPGTLTVNMFYIATAAGTYSNFGGAVLSDGELAFISWNGEKWQNDKISIGQNNAVNTPDEEDITVTEDKKLKLKDRSFGDGMGYVILRKNKTFAEQVTKANAIYEIRYDFDLSGAEIELPNNVEFKFNGGSIYNGTLAGELRNKRLNVGDFGIAYDDISKSYANTLRLQIFSKITSDIQLYIEKDVYFNNYTSFEFVANNVSFVGDGATIYLRNWQGFVAKNLSAVGLRVNGYDNSYYGTFFKVPSFEGGANVDIKGCHFSGNIRVLSSAQRAIDEAHYIDNLVVENCEFDNIWCTAGVNTIFDVADTFVNKVNIISNRVHNFSAQLFDFGITNGSSYEALIKGDTSHPRVFYANGNIVSNDLAWKPWEREGVKAPGAYFCFILAEYGTAYVCDNVFSGILAYNDTTACYDNYLSVETLYYERNAWSNIGNLKSGDNRVILKSKTGHGLRLYEGNTFTMSNISDVVGIEDVGIKSTYIFDTDENVGVVKVRNNSFTLAGLYCNAYNEIKCDSFEFSDNTLNVAEVSATSRPGIFSGSSVEDTKININNNVISVSSAQTSIYLFCKADAIKNIVNINGNKCINVNGCYYGGSEVDPSVVRVADNIFEIGASASEVLFARYVTAQVLLADNYVETEAANFSIIRNASGAVVRNMRIKPSANGRIVAIPTFQYGLVGGLFLADCSWSVNGKHYNSEVLINRISSSEIKDSCFDYYGDSKIDVNTQTYMWNGLFDDPNPCVASIGGGVTIQALADSVMSINVNLQKAPEGSALRKIPPVCKSIRPSMSADQVGQSIFDYTLGKQIYWNRWKWVDATGTAV